MCYAWWIYFLNIKSSFLWVPTVFLFSSTSICIRMRQTSYRDFSRSTNRSSSDPFISLSAISGYVLSLYKFGLYCWSHLSHWPWDKGYPDTVRSFSYTDLHLEKHNECWIRTKLRKKHYSYFPIVSFEFICNHIPAAPVYMVYISQYRWCPITNYVWWFCWSHLSH